MNAHFEAVNDMADTFVSGWPSWLPPADSDAPPLWVVFVAFLLASFSQGISGFGQAIIWNFLMRLAATVLSLKYDLQKTVALLVGGDIIVASSIVIMGRMHIDFQVVFRIGIPLLIFTIIGNAALIYVDVVILQRAIGAVILIYSIYRWLELRASLKAAAASPSELEVAGASQVAPEAGALGAVVAAVPEVSKPATWVGVVCGCGAGFLGGCTGISGPVLAMYFSSTSMSKTAVRSTFQCCLLGMTVLNTGMMFAEGVITIKADIVDYAVIIVAGFLGVNLGNVVHHWVSDVFVRCMMLVLCLAASCTLLAAGSLLLSVCIALAVAVLMTIVVAVGKALGVVRARRRACAADTAGRRPSRALEEVLDPALMRASSRRRLSDAADAEKTISRWHAPS